MAAGLCLHEDKITTELLISHSDETDVYSAREVPAILAGDS